MVNIKKTEKQKEEYFQKYLERKRLFREFHQNFPKLMRFFKTNVAANSIAKNSENHRERYHNNDTFINN